MSYFGAYDHLFLTAKRFLIKGIMRRLTGPPKTAEAEDVETSPVPPNLHRRQHKDESEQRQEDGANGVANGLS